MDLERAGLARRRMSFVGTFALRMQDKGAGVEAIEECVEVRAELFLRAYPDQDMILVSVFSPH